MKELPIGRGVVVRPGNRVAILNFGALFQEAMTAGEELDATVVDMRWVKPLDEELILDLAASHELLLTVEENAIAGGAGSAVSEVLTAKAVSCTLRHVGIPDGFVDHGDQAMLRREAGLLRDRIQSIAAEQERETTAQVAPLMADAGSRN
jgi:1-deoxy-D-xylulose-5-phosphate synthase